MTTTPAHLCLTCKFAEWKHTSNGHLHPEGYGKCGWTRPHIPTPAVMWWNIDELSGGAIDRHPWRPITDCETYEAKP